MLGTRTSPSAQRAAAGSGVSKEMSLQLKFTLRAHADEDVPLPATCRSFQMPKTFWAKHVGARPAIQFRAFSVKTNNLDWRSPGLVTRHSIHLCSVKISAPKTSRLLLIPHPTSVCSAPECPSRESHLLWPSTLTTDHSTRSGDRAMVDSHGECRSPSG